MDSVFGHGSIRHYEPQRPVSRGFSLFKSYEWLVSKRVAHSEKLLGICHHVPNLTNFETILYVIFRGF